ncbi:MAG: transglutaminase domain-containing protein [Clostridiales bacterium]|nr:transglutaminase domain-containing protein [Clostridiales bacterium]
MTAITAAKSNFQALRARVDIPRIATWLIDFTVVFTLLASLSLCAFQVIGYECTPSQIVITAALITLIISICAKKWWIAPSILIVLSLVIFVLYLRYDDFSILADYWKGFIGWCISGMPELYPYSENNSVYLVEALLMLPLGIFLYAFVRKFFSFTALFLPCAVLIVLLYYYSIESYHTVILLMLMSLGGALPRVMNRSLKYHNGDKNKSVPRHYAQMIAVPLAVVCAFTSVMIVPKNDGVWRSDFINTAIRDLTDAYNYYTGNYSDIDFSITVAGLKPLGTRLGGNIKLNNRKLMSATTDVPVLLKSSVYDTYTGNSWVDTEQNGRFRFDSFIWRTRKNKAFSLDLPAGSGEVKKLYDKMSRELKVELYATVKKDLTYMSFGSVSDIVRPKRVDAAPIYFNSQGELFTGDLELIEDGYTVTARFLDRNLDGFDENMAKLEEMLKNRGDRAYEDIALIYTTLPETLPQSVRDLTLSLTDGIESPYQKAKAIEDWLKENCTYTTEPGDPPEDRDFVDYFLETKEGYCVYYASAMTVMARSAGLPARYVLGYGMKEDNSIYNMYSNRWLTAVSTAHAWCEVYLKGIGWVTFDPLGFDTSPFPEEERVSAPVVHTPDPDNYAGDIPEEEITDEPPLSESDLINLTSNDNSQNELMLKLLIIAASVIVAFILLYLLYRYIFNRYFRNYDLERVKKKFSDNSSVADFYYSDIIKQLEFFGVDMKDGETVLSYCEKADRFVRIGTYTMKMAGEIIMRSRYGNIAPTDDELRRIFFLHDSLESQMLENMGKSKYFWQRAVFSSSSL